VTQVENRLKPPPIDCPDGCGKTGQPLRNGHVRGCPIATCATCRNRRNRKVGQDRQRRARKALGIPKAKQAGTLGNEEHWRGAFRVEVKAGAQTKPAATRFLRDESQSLASKAEGDPRPFLDVLMPDGMKDGIVQLRLSTWRQWIVPLLEEAS